MLPVGLAKRRQARGGLAIAIALSIHGTPLAGAAPRPVDLAALQLDDEAVLTVGYRLQTSAGDLCAATVPIVGLSVHDLGQYAPAYRAAAARLFARADLPAVLAVAHGGAAERAGMRPGDAIAAIDGASVRDAGNEAGDGLQRAEAVQGRIDASAAAGPVDMTVIRAGRSFVARIVPARGCATQFQTLVSPELNARADGTRVEVTTGLLRFVHGPDELAAVLAHELAHNVLHHRERLDAAGRGKRLIRQTEAEADQLSVHLVDRAGYSTAAIVSFWERMRRDKGGGPFASENHPTDKQRIAATEAEIARLGGTPQPPSATGSTGSSPLGRR